MSQALSDSAQWVRRPRPPARPSKRRSILLVIGFYLVCLAFATKPMFWKLGDALPADSPDAMMHLWVMRWYKSCLLEGRAPVFCTDIQYPAGAPLCKFSPLQLQALLYLPLSFLTSNDVLCYNLLWLGGFLLTGVGTYLLIRHEVDNRVCAAIGGLATMLCGSMMVHARGHLELLYVGAFSLFLLAWIRLLDAPDRRRLLAAVAAYVLVAMAAAYYMIQAIFPAVLYLGWRAAREGRANLRPWLRSRIPWILKFVALALPALFVVFAPQVWAAMEGVSVARPESHFEGFRAPLWSYLAPTSLHRLNRLVMPFDVYAHSGFAMTLAESASYLGLATLLLLTIAWGQRRWAPRVSFWWLLFAVMVVLALGPWWSLGTHKIPLPSRWLWEHVFFFRWTRNPGRFNLYATIAAGVLAAVGLQAVFRHVRWRAGRMLVGSALTFLIVVDLGMNFPAVNTIPPPPAAYEFARAAKPQPTLLEIPLVGSAMPLGVTSACGYWQSITGVRTTAGYSGNDNADFDNRIYHASPFSFRRPSDPPAAVTTMSDPDYLADPGPLDHLIVRGNQFDDYVWLFTRANQFDFIVLHKWDIGQLGLPGAYERLRERLRIAEVHEDDRTVVYDPDRLPEPTSPTLVCTSGWRYHHPWEQPNWWRGRTYCATDQTAELWVVNPEPRQPIRVQLVAAGFRERRVVRLMRGEDELARWSVDPGAWSNLVSPPLDLPAGPQVLTIECDGDYPVTRPEIAPAETDFRPVSLLVAKIGIDSGEAAPVLAGAAEPASHR